MAVSSHLGSVAPSLMQDTFLTVAEIAEHLKVNQQTVRNWIEAGTLKAVRIGSRRVRVRESDLEAFIDRGGDVDRTDQPGADTTGSRQRSAGTATARNELAGALQDGVAALANGDDTQLIAALQRVAATALELATVIASHASEPAS
jgi:excisionase family DNA binding protein